MEKNMTKNPRYDVLLKQAQYIIDNAPGKLGLVGGNKDDVIFDTATSGLADICMNLAYDSNEECKSPCSVEDGMCICPK